MRIIITISLVVAFSSGAALSQSNREDFRRTRIGVMLSPDLSYRVLSYNEPNAWIEDIRNSREKSIYGITGGLGLNYDLSENTVLESGIFFSVKGYQTSSMGLKWPMQNQSYPVSSKVRFSFKFLELPLRLKYFISSGERVRFFVAAGPSINFFMQRKTTVVSELPDGDKNRDHSTVNAGYSRFSLAAVAGIGVEYYLSQRVLITAEPVYRQFVTSLVVDDDAKEYPYSVGMNVGVYYRLLAKDR